MIASHTVELTKVGGAKPGGSLTKADPMTSTYSPGTAPERVDAGRRQRPLISSNR